VDRRKFIGGVAGNLLAAPLAAWAAPTTKPKAGPSPPSKLSSLAANTARNLGRYSSGAPGSHRITDYSGIVYDPSRKRMCLFGGGHGPSQETSIRIFDPATARWSHLYPPTPYSDMVRSNLDTSFGRWVSTNQPTARHSYNNTCVWGDRFYMFTVLGQPDNLIEGVLPYGGRICWYDFTTAAWTYFDTIPVPWAFTSACVVDPVSGMILIIGPTAQSGPGQLWVWDPGTNTHSNGPTLRINGGAKDLVYFPPNDRFYSLSSGGAVYEVTFSRDAMKFASATLLTTSGTPPPAMGNAPTGFAYDSVNRIIGGHVSNGTFYAFDPASRVWTAVQMSVEAGSVDVPTQAFHCIEFDPESGCFIFLSEARKDTTWAYRYGGAPSSGTRATGVDDLGISLDFGGANVAVFSGSAAVDQGDFVGEFVQQKCFLARDPAFPDWRVYFRVDADHDGNRIVGAGARDEVVVEYGRSSGGVPSHIQTAYTATISSNGNQVARYVVPKHWWYARWRYQSSPRPVVRSPALLKARGWIPNFGPAGLFGGQPNTAVINWGGPMSAPPGFSNFMAGTGDNHQIGFLTEYAANYAIFETSSSLISLRTEGEWCGNWGMHIRDDATGAILDVRNNKLRFKSEGGTVNNAPGVSTASNPGFVALDAAHFYPCSNLPWLLTDDPYYLEELQFSGNWQILYGQYHRNLNKLQGMVYPGQTRAFAWGLRDLFQLAATCPVSVPSWLRPRSYWRSCVNDNRLYAEKFVKSPARIHALFKTWTRSDVDGAWQAAWLNAVVGMAVSQGFSEWLPIFQWGVDKHIQQTNGTSGWPRQWPVPYYSIPNKAAVWETPTNVFNTTAVDATTCTSWADYWAYYKSGSPDSAGVGHSDASGSKINDAGWDGHTIMQRQSGPSYFLHLRAVLAVAAGRRVPGAQACYDYIQSELSNDVMPRLRKTGQARFSIEPESVVTAPTLSTNRQGLWWNDPDGSESGWGINLAHQADIIFATWFTYDFKGKAWWLSMTAVKEADNTFKGDLYQSNGPSYQVTPFDPRLVNRRVVGSATLAFRGNDTGTFTYVVNGFGQTKNIIRAVFAEPVPTCEFASSGNPPDTRNYQDLWEAEPSGSESGWGINLMHQGDIIFATWFTYDPDGAPLWLVFTAELVTEGVYTGTLYRTLGPALDAIPFDPNAVVRVPAGSATLSFNNSSKATFEYTVDGVAGGKTITRQVFREPGTACQ
jgi:hypothetical protein